MNDEALACFAEHPNLVSLICDGRFLTEDKTLEFVRSLPHVEYVSFGQKTLKTLILDRVVEREVKRIVASRSNQQQSQALDSIR
ncbi:MAG: hypothetical protein IT422_00975 [Pirellulaceae bacterium]|jgi:hypothetical protein|nr:hypothetical protein [Pirellulaceae bacterium]